MGIDGVADHLSNELVDEDDAYVITCQEAPVRGERKRNERVKYTKQTEGV